MSQVNRLLLKSESSFLTRNVVRAHSFIQLRVTVERRQANCFLAVRDRRLFAF